MNMKNFTIFILILCIFSGTQVFGQTLLGLSVGSGVGMINHNFTDSGADSSLVYSAPAAYIDAELCWDDWYMEMGLSILVFPFSVTQGGTEVSLNDYSMNSAMDFTALGIGYLFSLSDSVKLGGSIGFHVSSIALSPPTEDSTKLTIEGYYGTIGLSFTPRLRIALSKDLQLTFNFPVGVDFGPMSDEVVTPAGATGITNPAVVAPDTLVPQFSGFTVGAYVSIGYFFEI